MPFMGRQNKCYWNECSSKIQLFITGFAYNDTTFLFFLNSHKNLHGIIVIHKMVLFGFSKEKKKEVLLCLTLTFIFLLLILQKYLIFMWKLFSTLFLAYRTVHWTNIKYILFLPKADLWRCRVQSCNTPIDFSGVGLT